MSIGHKKCSLISSADKESDRGVRRSRWVFAKLSIGHSSANSPIFNYCCRRIMAAMIPRALPLLPVYITLWERFVEASWNFSGWRNQNASQSSKMFAAFSQGEDRVSPKNAHSSKGAQRRRKTLEGGRHCSVGCRVWVSVRSLISECSFICLEDTQTRLVATVRRLSPTPLSEWEFAN